MVMTGTGDWCQLIHASQRHVRQVDSRQGQLMSVVRARRPRRARRGVAVVVADEMTPQCGGVQRIRLGTQVLACRHHVVDNVDSVRFNSAAGQWCRGRRSLTSSRVWRSAEVPVLVGGDGAPRFVDEVGLVVRLDGLVGGKVCVSQPFDPWRGNHRRRAAVFEQRRTGRRRLDVLLLVVMTRTKAVNHFVLLWYHLLLQLVLLHLERFFRGGAGGRRRFGAATAEQHQKEDGHGDGY